MSFTAERLRPFGPTIFAEMTRLANEHSAINLSQGFPDFDGPKEVIEAAAEALRSGQNQYARSMGVPELVTALSEMRKKYFGLEYDPMTEVLVTSGATECIASSILGLLNPGDEVILFEPFYDSYPANVAMAGGVPRFYTLRFPDFRVEKDELEKLINDKTRLIVLNTPHNPTGKVFSRAELEIVSQLCQKHDLIVLADEVYEHLTFDGAEHVSIAALPGMRERTIAVSSAGKSFSITGWKIGWAYGPKDLLAAVQAAHQFVTFATSTPLQIGLARSFSRLPADYFEVLRKEYVQRRDFLISVLEPLGFKVAKPLGTYFVLADFSALSSGKDDRAFAEHLVRDVGVATIPPSGFYHADPAEGRKLIRFAFCKKMETLHAAAERLRSLETY